MKEEKKEKKFISLLSDTTFKYLFKNDEYRSFFNNIIKSIIDVDISNFKLYDAELNSGNLKRDYRLDILLVNNDIDIVISIEMNQFPSELAKYKNRLYVYTLLSKSLNSGQDIKKKYIIQVNFNKEKHPYVSKVAYSLMDEESKKEIKDFKIYDVYLENYKGIIYNGDNKEEMYLSLFTAESYEELKEIVKDEKEALKIVDELEKLGINDELGAVYDNEQMQKRLLNTAHNWGYDDGKVEGQKEEQLTIAKNFLKDGIPIEVVSKNTGLSIEELKELNKEAL